MSKHNDVDASWVRLNRKFRERFNVALIPFGYPFDLAEKATRTDGLPLNREQRMWLRGYESAMAND